MESPETSTAAAGGSSSSQPQVPTSPYASQNQGNVNSASVGSRFGQDMVVGSVGGRRTEGTGSGTGQSLPVKPDERQTCSTS